jgi:hypothetical protein
MNTQPEHVRIASRSFSRSEAPGSMSRGSKYEMPSAFSASVMLSKSLRSSKSWLTKIMVLPCDRLGETEALTRGTYHAGCGAA